MSCPYIKVVYSIINTVKNGRSLYINKTVV